MGNVFFGGGKVGMEKPSNLPSIGTALNDMEWAKVRAISDEGLAANYFAVGDTKTITINGKVGLPSYSSKLTISNLSIDAFIIGIDHNSDVEGANRIHFQIGKIGGNDVALIGTEYGQANNTTGTFIIGPSGDNGPSNAGGWEECQMRTIMLGNSATPTSPPSNSFMAALPSDLRAVMKSVDKYTNNAGNYSNSEAGISATTDYLFLLAEFEVLGKRSYASAAEQNHQKQYEYYAAGNSKVKYAHNATSTSCRWWIRSPYASNSDGFCCIAENGTNTSQNYSYWSYGLCPAFCV